MRKKLICFALSFAVEIAFIILVLIFAKEPFSQGYGIGFAVSMVAITFVSLIMTIKGKNKKEEFDERQQLARGKCYKYAFFTMLGYMIFNMLINEVFAITWAEESIKLYIGLCASVMTFVVTAILNDAYFPVNDNNSLLSIVFLIVLSSTLFVYGLYQIISGEAITDHMLNTQSVTFFCGIALFPIWVAKVLRRYWLGKESESEEE